MCSLTTRGGSSYCGWVLGGLFSDSIHPVIIVAIKAGGRQQPQQAEVRIGREGTNGRERWGLGRDGKLENS